MHPDLVSDMGGGFEMVSRRDRLLPQARPARTQSAGLQGLEPYDGKLSRTVLRRLSRG